MPTYAHIKKKKVPTGTKTLERRENERTRVESVLVLFLKVNKALSIYPFIIFYHFCPDISDFSLGRCCFGRSEPLESAYESYAGQAHIHFT